MLQNQPIHWDLTERKEKKPKPNFPAVGHKLC